MAGAATFRARHFQTVTCFSSPLGVGSSPKREVNRAPKRAALSRSLVIARCFTDTTPTRCSPATNTSSSVPQLCQVCTYIGVSSRSSLRCDPPQQRKYGVGSETTLNGPTSTRLGASEKSVRRYESWKSVSCAVISVNGSGAAANPGARTRATNAVACTSGTRNDRCSPIVLTFTPTTRPSEVMVGPPLMPGLIDPVKWIFGESVCLRLPLYVPSTMLSPRSDG